MAFKISEDHLAKKRAEFMFHVDENVQDMVRHCDKMDTRITLETYESLRINSYERKFIRPWLSDEALISEIENALKNSRESGEFKVPSTYTEYLATEGIEELLKRFKSTKGTWPVKGLS